MASIEGHLPAGEALRRLARNEIAQLARQLAAAEKGANAHPIRKRLKYLRSLMRMLRPAIGEDAFQAANSHLRAAAMQLALKRHGEAMVEAVAKLRKQAEGEDEIIAELETAAIAHASAAEETHAEGTVDGAQGNCSGSRTGRRLDASQARQAVLSRRPSALLRARPQASAFRSCERRHTDAARSTQIGDPSPSSSRDPRADLAAHDEGVVRRTGTIARIAWRSERS